MSFSFLRRLHLSLLLPAVLTTFVILVATLNSVTAQQSETSSLPQTEIIKAPELAAPLVENIMTWQGNVEFDYQDEQITATAEKAEYFQGEQKIVLTGNVRIFQADKSQEVETATFFIKGKFKISGDSSDLPVSKK